MRHFIITVTLQDGQFLVPEGYELVSVVDYRAPDRHTTKAEVVLCLKRSS